MSTTENVDKITHINIHDLVNYFRESLTKLIPIFDNAGIKWQDDDQFDDYEGIAESLFRWIVLFHLETFIQKKHNFTPDLPQYNYFYKDYSKLSFIDVMPKESKSKGFYVFLSLASKSSPFDTIVCNEIDASGKIVNRGLEFSYNDANFKFQLRMKQ